MLEPPLSLLPPLPCCRVSLLALLTPASCMLQPALAEAHVRLLAVATVLVARYPFCRFLLPLS